MKTSDLIPLILLELIDSDKYGLEITKSIESKSDGKIIIKQPTLYTILKKLEKSKFISSYWQDSDIGGKRHYYKITENGKQQASTLPSFDTIVNKILSTDTEDSINSSTQINEELNNEQTNEEDIKNYSIMDRLDDRYDDVQYESILPSEEVFESDHIDNTTEMEINMANKEILLDSNTSRDELFANNKDIMKFTEKASKPAVVINNNKIDLNNFNENLQPKSTIQESLNISKKEIKYVDYIDLKKEKTYIYAKNTAKNMLYRILSSVFSLILILALCTIITSFTDTSALYYVCIILSVCVIIFCPAIYAFKYQDYISKLQKHFVKFDIKKRILISILIEIIVLVICILVNISIGNNSFIEMLKFDNFANFYAPLLLAGVVFLDCLFVYLFLIKKSTSKK